MKRFLSVPLLFIAACLWLMISSLTYASSNNYDLDYTVELIPEDGVAKVTIALKRGDLLRHMNFKELPSYQNISANGKLEKRNGRVYWQLPEKSPKLQLTVKINRSKGEDKFDALMTKDWAIFRGDSLIPAAVTEEIPGAASLATLTFKLPEGWSVETGWPRKRGNSFRIDNPERLYDRPVGWMIAGKLGTRRTDVNNTQVVVSAPIGEQVRKMDLLTYVTFVWPQLQRAFGQSPNKLLIVGAGDPMWRGGLSASNSIFLHKDRPLVSENGTSPLVHELFHMVTRISGVETDAFSDDWIAEGLAEYYSFELLFRAGALNELRRSQIIKQQAAWGEKEPTVRTLRSHGPVTAKAVVWFNSLDSEIKTKTVGKANLDDVVKLLIPIRKVSLSDLKDAAEKVAGGSVEAFDVAIFDKPKLPKAE